MNSRIFCTLRKTAPVLRLPPRSPGDLVGASGVFGRLVFSAANSVEPVAPQTSSGNASSFIFRGLTALGVASVAYYGYTTWISPKYPLPLEKKLRYGHHYLNSALNPEECPTKLQRIDALQKAEKYFSEALQIAEQIRDRDPQDRDSELMTAHLYGEYAKVMEVRQRSGAAAEYFLKQLKILVKFHGRQSLQVVGCCRELARTYQKGGMYEDALGLLRTCYFIMAELLGNSAHPPHVELSGNSILPQIALVSQLSSSSLTESSGESATEHFHSPTKNSHNATQDSHSATEDSHSSTEDSNSRYRQNDRHSVRDGSKKTSQAHITRIEIPEAKEEAELLGRLCEQIGIVLAEVKQYNQAIHWFSYALECAQKSLGIDHLQCATILTSIANAYYELGDYENAVKLSRKSLDVAESHGVNMNTCTALYNLGSALKQLGRYDDAKLKMDLALTAAKHLGVEEHVQMITQEIDLVDKMLNTQQIVDNTTS